MANSFRERGQRFVSCLMDPVLSRYLKECVDVTVATLEAYPETIANSFELFAYGASAEIQTHGGTNGKRSRVSCVVHVHAIAYIEEHNSLHP